MNVTIATINNIKAMQQPQQTDLIFNASVWFRRLHEPERHQFVKRQRTMWVPAGALFICRPKVKPATGSPNEQDETLQHGPSKVSAP
jgi:hypothetical protein